MFSELDPKISCALMFVIVVSVAVVIVTAFVCFFRYGGKSCKKSMRSIVTPGNIIIFYMIYFLVLLIKPGKFDFSNLYVIITGAVMIAAGAVVNILSIFQLKGNWSNSIKIYEEHVLVRRGVYRIVRHPLYSSIIVILFGGSLVFVSWLGLALTSFVFIPFIYYRAKQEEVLLNEEFTEYKEYAQNTGMLFPRLRK